MQGLSKSFFQKIKKETTYYNRKPSYKEKIMLLVKNSLIILIISYLFFDTYIAFFIFSPTLFFLQYYNYKSWVLHQKEILLGEFKELLNLCLTSLKAGYSIENAFIVVEQELISLYGSKSLMVKEIQQINYKVKNHLQVEKLFLDFAMKSDLDEIKEFAQIFVITKRIGGDFGKIIEQTIHIIGIKIELKEQIITITASKIFEQRIMNAIPFAIIIYISITNPGYFEPLYHNLFGYTFMSVILIFYFLAVYISQKVSRII